MSSGRQSHNIHGPVYVNSRRSSSSGATSWIRRPGSKLSQLNRLVLSDRSETPELAAGNSLVDWNYIRCIDILTETAPICSICLDEVFLPQMLQCGHCFCLSCILLHLSSSSNCCVCSEYARPGELRSVRLQIVSHVITGTTRSFELVRTCRGVTLPLCTTEEYIPSQKTVGWWFSRVVTCTDEETRRFHFGELERLSEIPSAAGQEGIHAFGSTLSLEFIQSRIASLPEPSVASPSSRTPDPDRGYVSIKLSDLPLLPREFLPTEACSFSYQLVDGQHVYLEPVWVRVLLHHYTGDADGWGLVGELPRSLSLPVVHTSSFTVDFDLRKRYKLMAHLPIGSSVTLCDVDLRGLVLSDTLQALEVPIARRLELIKKMKAKRKLDKRDVKRANAIPLSEEWGLACTGFPSPAMDKIPSDEDFVALPSSGGVDPPLPLETRSFAAVAEDLAGSVFYSATPPHSSEDDMLLARYSRRPSEQNTREISEAINRAEQSLSGREHPKKKGFVKLRIAG